VGAPTTALPQDCCPIAQEDDDELVLVDAALDVGAAGGV
jgi:hypothetical protein